MAKRPSQPTASEIDRDGRFIASDNGTVLDTRTNLMWAAEDNGGNIDWANTKAYCESYRGVGYTDWRMPTQAELAGFYDMVKTYKSDWGIDFHLTELIHLTHTSFSRGFRYARFRCCPLTFQFLHAVLGSQVDARRLGNPGTFLQIDHVWSFGSS
jgi:hypothetical protein